MVKFTLQSQTPLRGYSNRFGNTVLTELSDTAIFSVGLALESKPALKSIESKFGAPWPITGDSTISANGIYRLLGLQTDQIFVLVNTAQISYAQATKLPELESRAYITDQSDSWAGVKIEGENVVSVLERICPIDLHASVFRSGQVMRTSMEHLSVIVLQETEKRFLLLSPASSARSFQHALETSLRNV